MTPPKSIKGSDLLKELHSRTTKSEPRRRVATGEKERLCRRSPRLERVE
jgi:hypothetical protein